MGYFQVRYDSRVVNYERRGFIRLATDLAEFHHFDQYLKIFVNIFKFYLVLGQSFQLTMLQFVFFWANFHC